MFQENKVRQIFQKNEHFLPPDMHMYVLLKIHRSFKTTTFPFTEVQPSELVKKLVKNYDSGSCYPRSWFIGTLTLFPVSSWNIRLRVMLLQVFQDANLFRKIVISSLNQDIYFRTLFLSSLLAKKCNRTD